MTATLNCSLSAGVVVTSDTSGSLALQTAGTTAVTIDTSQNVGIGTSSPASKLHVESSSVADLTEILKSTDAVNGRSVIYMASAKNSAGTQSNVSMEAQSVSSANADLVFRTGGSNVTAGSERMRIDSSGNVGIGTSSPAVKLQVVDVDPTIRLQTNTASGVRYAEIQFYNAAGSKIGTIGTSPYGGASILYNNVPTSWGYNWQINSTAAMTLDSSGKLLVGTTTASGNGLLQLTQATTNSDTAVFRNSSASPYGIVVDWTGADPNNASNYVFGGYDSFSSTWMYRIYGNGTVAARSDARFKKNIETARNGYAEDLSKLRVVKYNWINNEDTDPKEIGLIAQEVEQVFPNLIQTDTSENGVECKSIKFSVLPIMLLKAIQEQQLLITQLQADIAAIKAGA